MKKLMFASAAMALVGGAFGAPLVYDYKASVKHLYLKSVTVKLANRTTKVYQKFQKSSSLKGYLIQDFDGATSPTIQTAKGITQNTPATSADYGRNRSFLVVLNPGAEADYRLPKILPACLEAKFLDTNFSAKKVAKTGLAEGILYAGGDAIKGVRPQIDDVFDGSMQQPNLVARTADFWTQTLPDAQKPGMVAYADYVWTSVYLFGRYNGPNWYAQDNGAGAKVIPFPDFEYAWDQNLPTALMRNVDQATGGVDANSDGNITKSDIFNYFHDTWLNGTGFGKYFIPGDTVAGDVCCGLDKVTTSYTPVLDTLSGNAKGGLFICTENGIDATPAVVGTYDFFDGDMHRWEDQFISYRLETATTYPADGWQNDLWQDGAVDQATTDVISGTWSIKYNKKFFATKNPIYRAVTVPEVQVLTGNPDATGVEVAEGLEVLVGSIKGAVLKLQPTATWLNGAEIYMAPATVKGKNLPVVTPQFAEYYGLADWN